MAAWIVGSNIPGRQPDSPVDFLRDRHAAVDRLIDLAFAFSTETVAAAESRNETSDAVSRVADIFAAIIPDDGPASFTLTDNDGWGRIFFMAESPEGRS